MSIPPEGDADVAAMLRLAGGEDLALNEIMERWTPRLAAYFGRLVGHEAETVDLVQETFLAIYRARLSYRPRAAFSTWLFGIASNLARQRLRWMRRHPEVAWELEHEVGAPASGGVQKDPSEEMEAGERAAAVRSAVLALPEDLREALVLADYEGLGHAECAVILRCSPKAVETRVYRAKQLLRKSLQPLLG